MVPEEVAGAAPEEAVEPQEASAEAVAVVASHPAGVEDPEGSAPGEDPEGSPPGEAPADSPPGAEVAHEEVPVAVAVTKRWFRKSLPGVW